MMDIHDAFSKLREQSSSNPPLTREMNKHVKMLEEICANSEVTEQFNKAVSGIPEKTAKNEPNIWKQISVPYFIEYFCHWFTTAPLPGKKYGYLFPFEDFYYKNPEAKFFLHDFKSKTGNRKECTTEIFNWIVQFISVRRKFMSSPQSKPIVDIWLSDASNNHEHFKVPRNGFKSFNDFETRELDLSKNPRPVVDPDNDSIISSPTDGTVKEKLTNVSIDTEVQVKNKKMTLRQLMGDSGHSHRFEKCSVISSEVEPGSYHHFHSPVNGTIIEGRDIKGTHHGIADGKQSARDKNLVGDDDTIFEDYHRQCHVFKTGSAHVAMVTVGLATLSEDMPTVISDPSTMVGAGCNPLPVRRGTRIGNFSNGGSLNVLVFQAGSFEEITSTTETVSTSQVIGSIIV